MDCPRPGRPPKDRLARQIVDTQMHNSPHANGLVQACWTVGLLVAFLAARFRLALSARTVRRHLHASGWRWARPRLDVATHAPRGQRKEDPAAPLKLRLIERALGSAASVVYLDECDLQLLPVVRAMWMKGPRLRIPTPGQNAKRTIFGALDARTGALHQLIRPRKRAVDFIAFLDHLAQAYPTGEVVLVLDNVITHDAKLVRAWRAQPEHARFRLLWLPKYAAHEHNPHRASLGPAQGCGCGQPSARQHRGAGQRGRALLHYPSLPGPASAHCGSSVTRPGCLRSMPFLHLRA